MATAADELRCVEIVEVVTDYLDGILSPAWRDRFDEHLAVCPYCRIYLEQMRQTIRLLGCRTVESIPAKDKLLLLALFRDWNKQVET